LSPCLIEAATNQPKDTIAKLIVDRSELKSYNKKNGWYVNWAQLLKENEVYGIYIKGQDTPEGLIAIKQDSSASAVYMSWGCAAPHNNKQMTKAPKYTGVGGHLFAIAAEKSFQYGFDGYLYGFAADAKLLKHYIKVFGAWHAGMLHEFHFVIEPDKAKKLMEVYNYDWSNR